MPPLSLHTKSQTAAAGTLARRSLALILVLGAEALAASLLLDGQSLAGKNGFLTAALRQCGAWSVKACIGFAALFAAFAYLRYKPALVAVSERLAATPVRLGLLAAHFGAMGVFGFLSAALYGGLPNSIPPDLLVLIWMAAASSATVLAALALAPMPVWRHLVFATERLWLYAAGASTLACMVGSMSWSLWQPASNLTFAAVRLILSPFLRDMVVKPEAMLIGTHRFTAIISPQCSGLEGVGLVLIFGGVFLFLFRDEVRFPQAFALVPAGMVTLFALNAFRIAALIAIGNAGAREIAARGFHSQAGWITFNVVALAFCTAARHVQWFSRQAPAAAVHHEYPAAPYVLPLLAIMAAGMLSAAVTARFEWAYALRLPAALAAFWIFRRRYTAVDWRFGWVGPITGFVVFAVWMLPEQFTAGAHAPVPMPGELAASRSVVRAGWISCRVLVGVLAVPIAEEFAFRGFLLRRLICEDFEWVAFGGATWLPIAVSSMLFGLLHGRRWLAGAVAGVLFALVLRYRPRLGEAVAAHATANALLACYVLLFHDWSVW